MDLPFWGSPPEVLEALALAPQPVRAISAAAAKAAVIILRDRGSLL